MRLKYSKTLLDAQDTESPIADICWSPNNVKLAVATCERLVLLFDREGTRRDKFSTKPADSAAGKKSYVITSISFSDNSELLGIAQSDNMVFVYRVGADWSGKKVICNKFPLTGAPMSLLPADNGFYTGTSDGKIRSLDCKSNKSSSMWSGGACCVSLARGGEGTLASGHVDGTLYLNGRLLLRYALPPTALVLLPPYLIVGSCDGRVSVYEAQRGALLRSLEPQLPPDRRDLISAAPSPSGQTVAFGVFDGCLVGEVKESGGVELSMLNIPNFYAARALAWSGDGTKLALASQTGAVIQLEAVLRRWVWRDTVEVQHVSARQLVLSRLANDALPLTVTTKQAPDIFNVRFIGNDWYAVCRTSSTLILCDIARGLTSEIPWSGGGERVYAAVGGACLLHRAGELSVVEYGLDKVLHTVRTERVNPHVLSVRINEGHNNTDSGERKHLAYLLDRQTIAVVDLTTGVQLGQWWHEARVDWLELNENGQLLLLRDTRRRLALLRLNNGDKEIIASGVSFVQWIENSDAVVAQTPTHLLVWYSAWDPGSVEMTECGGAAAVEVISRRVVLDGGVLPYLQLDEHRLAFNNALRSGDLCGCARYLGGVGSAADVAPLWRQLAERALADDDVQVWLMCTSDLCGCARYLGGVGSAADVAPLWRQLAERALADDDVQVWLMCTSDLCGCARYLGGVGSAADVAPLWRQLAERALADDDVQVWLMCTSDLCGCARYLGGVGSAADVAPLWRQLAERALADDDVQVWLMCTSDLCGCARYLGGVGSAADVAPLWRQLAERALADDDVQVWLMCTSDLCGCARYLGGVGSAADVAPLWRQLAERALADDDVQLAAKCYREVDDVARTFYLEKIVELATAEGDGDVKVGLNNAIVRALLAIFAGDLSMAEECYVRRAARPDLAVDMYKQFNKWTDAIALAERTDRSSVTTLKQQHMDYLTSTGRLGEAGAVLASSGDAAGAVRLWLRGGRSRRAAALLLQQPQLLRDNDLLEAVHAQLIQEEWWETAGEISERRGDTRAAVEYYAKGNNYARAVQLAREACPGEVTRLEGAWGAWLVAARQAGAAVPHLIEAGQPRAALDAALAAHHHRKALQILQAIDDKDSIKEQCEKLGDHFISTREWETAERVLISCGMAERCVRAYNAAGRVADGLRLAAAQLSEERTRDIYMPLAQQLRADGQLRKAEQIYIGLGEPDEAISMYKEASQYEAMLRLVGAHRGSLLEATRRHVAQALHASGDLRAAENYYIQAGDWKSAIQMYRSAGQWEGAERVARAHAPSGVQQQVALQWAGALGGAPGARLLAARGLAALGARWALQAHRWDIAMELSSLGGGISRSEVAQAEAASLADERPEEAEAAFIRAGAAEHAVRMWLQHGKHQRALALAEQHAPLMVEEVLVEGAKAAAERGDLAQFETLMIRANRPREVVQHYRDLELWEEASRVSREYVADGGAEGAGADGEDVPGAVPGLLARAAAHADAAQWWDAVRLLAAASAAAAAAAPRLAERAALRAARLARDHLHDARRRAAADMLAERFAAIGQNDIGEQLRAALTEGYTEEDEAPGTSAEYEEEEAEAPREAEAEAEAEAEGLERLARAGHWQRCLAHAGHRAPHYALRYAAHLFKAHPRMEGIDIESEEPPEVLTQVLDVLRQYLGSGEPGIDSLTGNDAPLARAVCTELLVRVSTAPKSVSALKDAAAVMVTASADDRALQAITLLLALHVPQIAGKAARSLPRYTDIIVADVAYYMCGTAVRAEGAGGAREAFVMLNRCLDLAEAADDDSAHLLDYTDFECTDWSRSVLLLDSGAVRGAALDDAREWVLAVSMDQAVEQTLPVDSRGMYASSVPDSEACCVVTGYPLGSRLVTFTNGRCANREWWSRAVSAARGGGAAAALLYHVEHWCGRADYHHV